ncbi:hypothetical protein BKA82DRAFT_609441 [Pisolithus tinctorius]|uniref:Uncharacterized protein n=1 Tax=Pisolithus tinctorius Marx 270 TaxID=870435 RepID=A0A0C3J498_PISTI|nr:hypothetical protein BKA82DRAFT_609441 [Pisolithus tinctorius]KIO03883.1 hypothetical protein M404DRAFT_609441 [Pisolithus tinctorius Marx 270]
MRGSIGYMLTMFAPAFMVSGLQIHVSGVMIGGGGCILFMFMLPPLSWVWG